MSPDPTATRELVQIVPGRPTQDGAGVKLDRYLTPRWYASADPFLLLDRFHSERGEDYAGGFPPHPHRGFETVTYLLAGRMRHGDDQGNRGDLGPGSVQWMTAARGIVHEETPQQQDGLLWGYQLWVNLPASEKMGPPAYQDIDAARIPEVQLPGGTRVRVIAGELDGRRGPVRPRPTEPLYLDVQLAPGGRFSHRVPQGHTVLLVQVEGESLVGAKAAALRAHQVALLGPAGDVVVGAGPAPARLLVIAGRPLREPVAHHGPFVMNTDAEIEAAIADYQAGRLSRPERL